MALPVGVQTCTVTFGSAVTWFGSDVEITVTVTPSHNLVWAATGQPLLKFSKTVTAAAGEQGSIEVPYVDQPGFLDMFGNAFTMWAYTVSVKYAAESGSDSEEKAIQPLLGQNTIDLDLLPNGTITVGVTAPVAKVLSVNGMTGNVSLPGMSSYVHDQSTPASTWSITHNLGRLPLIQILDEESKYILTDVEHTNLNQLTVTFSDPRSGKAILL